MNFTMLNVIMLNVILLNVILLNVILLNIILLNVILLNFILLNAILLNAILLNVFMTNVMRQFWSLCPWLVELKCKTITSRKMQILIFTDNVSLPPVSMEIILGGQSQKGAMTFSIKTLSKVTLNQYATK